MTGWNLPYGCNDSDIPGYNDRDGQSCSECHNYVEMVIACTECQEEKCTCGEENYTELSECCKAQFESDDEHDEYAKADYEDSRCDQDRDDAMFDGKDEVEWESRY